MEFKTFLGLAILLTISAKFVRAADELDTTADNLDKLTPEQKKIIDDYEAIATLNYGDKCNYELEAKGNKVRENLKPYLKKLFTSAIKHGLSGSEDEFELTPSLEETQDELFAEIQEYTAKVQRAEDGMKGICNDTRTLYCDQEVGECRCGKAKKLKGFSFTQVDGHCKFEVGSGCIQSEFSGLTDALACRKGSNCVTAIDNLKCNFANSFQEALLNPTRFRKLVEMQGFACFCDKA